MRNAISIFVTSAVNYFGASIVVIGINSAIDVVAVTVKFFDSRIWNKFIADVGYKQNIILTVVYVLISCKHRHSRT